MVSRLHKKHARTIRVIGLTGSVGMGKSEAAKTLRQMGIAVFEADKAVHQLLAPGGAASGAVSQAFPEVVQQGIISRPLLGKIVFSDAAKRKKLEQILHPLVQQMEARAIQSAIIRRKSCIVLDIPLLFETGGEKRCDAVLVVSAPQKIQRQRVLARPHMTPEKCEQILRIQMPDAEKRRRADVVILTSLGKRFMREQLQQFLCRNCQK